MKVGKERSGSKEITVSKSLETTLQNLGLVLLVTVKMEDIPEFQIKHSFSWERLGAEVLFRPSSF